MEPDDILEKYISIFGAHVYPNLYEPDDIDYQLLRQSIINSPSEDFDKQHLPFEKFSMSAIKSDIISDHSSLFQSQTNNVTGINIDRNSNKEHRNLNGPIFYIKREGLFASGFYDSHTGYFHILKDSTVALIENSYIDDPECAVARMRFLKKACTCEAKWYRVKRDAVCKSPEAAACYVIGRIVSRDSWIDEKGRGIEYYYSSINSVSTDSEHGSNRNLECKQHLFSIILEHDSLRLCNAVGYYDLYSNHYFILKGSFINSLLINCNKYIKLIPVLNGRSLNQLMKKENNYYFPDDFEFSSPSQAATFILGRKVNGRTIWKDVNGKSLKEYFNL